MDNGDFGGNPDRDDVFCVRTKETMKTRRNGGLFFIVILVVLFLQTLLDWEFTLIEQLCFTALVVGATAMVLLGPSLEKD